MACAARLIEVNAGSLTGPLTIAVIRGSFVATAARAARFTRKVQDEQRQSGRDAGTGLVLVVEFRRRQKRSCWRRCSHRRTATTRMLVGFHAG